MATATIDQVTTTLTEQHEKIKTMMATVQDSDGDQRKSAFTQFVLVPCGARGGRGGVCPRSGEAGPVRR